MYVLMHTHTHTRTHAHTHTCICVHMCNGPYVCTADIPIEYQQPQLTIRDTFTCTTCLKYVYCLYSHIIYKLNIRIDYQQPQQTIRDMYTCTIRL